MISIFRWVWAREKPNREICISPEIPLSLSLFWGCEINIFSGIARRPCFDFRHLIQKPMWNRIYSTSKFKNCQRIKSSWEQQHSNEKLIFLKQDEEKVQRAQTRFNETNCERIAGINADNMCVVKSPRLNSVLKPCLHHVSASAVVVMQTERVFVSSPQINWNNFNGLVLQFLPLLLQCIHAAHSASHCFVHYHFGGLIARKYVRTQILRIECMKTRSAYSFRIAENYTKHKQCAFGTLHTAFTATVTELRCFYAHDFIRKSDDYSENAARPLIGIIRSYLFAFIFGLVAVAGSVDFSTPPIAFRCIAIIRHLLFGHTQTHSGWLREAARYIQCYVYFLMCLFVVFFLFSIDLEKPVSDFSICK